MRELRADPGGRAEPAAERSPPEAQPERLRVVHADWGVLAKAFSDDSGGVQWYLQAPTGRVVRSVESEHRLQVFSPDDGYLAIERARSKEQYRWMEQFIVRVGDREAAAELSHSIAGKRAFQRFKAVLLMYPGLFEEWQSFRAEQLGRHIRSWLRAHGLSVPEPRFGAAAGRDGAPGRPPPVRPSPLEAALEGLPEADLERLIVAARFLLSRARALDLEWDDRELGTD